MAKDTRSRMIETTARLLQHRGYHGTALSDILAASEAPRGSLYFHFPGGKEQLALEATRAAVEETTSYLGQCLADAKTPAQGVRAFVDATAQLMRDSGYTFGCPVAPVILDGSGDLGEFDSLCRETLRRWMAMLRESFAAAGIPERRARTSALLVVAAIEGALLIARAFRDCGPITDLAAELESLVAADLPRRRVRPAGPKARRKAARAG